MKSIIKLLILILLIGVLIHISCKKEYSCEGCADNNKNKPPIAIARPDQVITLPTESVLLDGRISSDPDGMISGWLWTKISGPLGNQILFWEWVFRVLDCGSSDKPLNFLITFIPC